MKTYLNTPEARKKYTMSMTINVYRQLLPISKSLRNSFEAECTSGESPRREKKQARLIAKAKELAENIGMTIYVQGDPRGCSLYLVENDGKNHASDYTNGIAIY